MKRQERPINYIPDNECWKVVGNKAHFHISKEFVYYEFKELKELEKWKINRSIENRKGGYFEDWQACNPDGTFNFEKMARLKRSIGIIQKTPESIAEMIGINDMLNKPTIYDDIDNVQIHSKIMQRSVIRGTAIFN